MYYPVESLINRVIVAINKQEYLGVSLVALQRIHHTTIPVYFPYLVRWSEHTLLHQRDEQLGQQQREYGGILEMEQEVRGLLS